MNSAILSALLGGIAIGLSSSWLLASLGRVAGISGIMAGLFAPKPDAIGFRVSFLLGLFIAGTAMTALGIGVSRANAASSWFALVAGGLLVGFGARLGGGCTSGHGVCGISRLSPRSIAATATFIITGVATVFVARHLFGGTP